MRKDDPPPVLALLAVFARAAELMERDERFRAHAYFPRLTQLLAVESGDVARMQSSFQHESEGFWRSLNGWLDGLDGALGLPTAEAIGHRYVGIPLSQALIRTADRHRFLHMFKDGDLEPGLDLSADDMALHLDRWIKSGHASASINKLWKSTTGMTIVAEAAAAALSMWDGSLELATQSGRTIPPPILTARVTRLPTGKRLRLGFAVRGRVGGHDGLPSAWVIRSAPGTPEVRVEPISDRLVAPDFVNEVDALTLLTGQLEVQPATHHPALRARPRRPQPLIVLSYVNEAGIWTEVDRVRLLETHLLIVNTEAKWFSGRDTAGFDELLREVAEPGFTRDDSLKGLPAGWALYRDVTVLRVHTSSIAFLEPLKPAQNSNMVVSGGLRLPGHAVRWHTDAPLVVKASAAGASELSLELRSADLDDPVASWSGEADEISASTTSLELGSGSYRAELTVRTGDDAHTSVVTFSLCDSDEPRPRTATALVAHDLTHPLGALTAAVLDGVGATKEASPVAAPVSPAEAGPVWWSLEPIRHTADVLASPPEPDGCAITGRHVWRVDQVLRGMTRVRAECEGCHRVTWYPAKGRAKQSDATPEHEHAPLRHLNFGVQAKDISGATLLDALTWLGGGTPSELARVVRQVYDSALTVDEIVRTLETLGHINVVRDPASFAVETWEMCPRALAGLEDGTWMVVGAWSRSDIAALSSVAEEHGGRLDSDEVDWLSRRVVSALDEPDALSVGHLLDAVALPQAGRRLLATLPPLSAALQALPRANAEGIFDAEWFDPFQARWVAVQSVGQPGAYRSRQGFVSSYFLRTTTDVAASELRRGDARVVKHLASFRRPLVGYDAGTSRLLVPLGAELPGLYGRAMSLLSGRPPMRVQGVPLRAYSTVAPDTAGALVSLMKG